MDWVEFFGISVVKLVDQFGSTLLAQYLRQGFLVTPDSLLIVALFIINASLNRNLSLSLG